MHILPRGLQRVRRYGLLANRSTAATLCRVLLPPPTPAPPTVAREVPAEFDDAPRCPHCPTGRLVLLIEAVRPSLFDVLLRSGFLPARLASRYATPTPHPDSS